MSRDVKQKNPFAEKIRQGGYDIGGYLPTLLRSAYGLGRIGTAMRTAHPWTPTPWRAAAMIGGIFGGMSDIGLVDIAMILDGYAVSVIDGMAIDYSIPVLLIHPISCLSPRSGRHTRLRVAMSNAPTSAPWDHEHITLPYSRTDRTLIGTPPGNRVTISVGWILSLIDGLS